MYRAYKFNDSVFCSQAGAQVRHFAESISGEQGVISKAVGKHTDQVTGTTEFYPTVPSNADELDCNDGLKEASQALRKIGALIVETRESKQRKSIGYT